MFEKYVYILLQYIVIFLCLLFYCLIFSYKLEFLRMLLFSSSRFLFYLSNVELWLPHESNMTIGNITIMIRDWQEIVIDQLSPISFTLLFFSCIFFILIQTIRHIVTQSNLIIAWITTAYTPWMTPYISGWVSFLFQIVYWKIWCVHIKHDERLSEKDHAPN